MGRGGSGGSTWRIALFGCLHVWVGGSAAAQEQPPPTTADAQELREAEALFDLSEEPESAPKAPPGGEASAEPSSVLYELAATAALVGNGGAPQTDLRLGADGAYRPQDLLQPRDTVWYPALSLMAYGEWQPAHWLLLRGLLNTFELRDGHTLQPPVDGLTMAGQPARAAVSKGAYIRELSITGMGRGFSLEVGRFRTRIADGLVHDDFASGLRARLDLGKLSRTDMRLSVMLGSGGPRIDEVQANTLMHISGELRFSPFEYVGLFIAGSKDRSGELTGVLRSALAEGRARSVTDSAYRGDLDRITEAHVQSTLLGTLDPCVITGLVPALDGDLAQEARTRLGCFGDTRGSGQLGYVGGRFQLLPVAGMSVRGALALMSGDFTIGVIDNLSYEEVDLHVEGWASDLEMHYGLSPELDLGGYGFLLSGDGPVGEPGTPYRAFIGLAPYWVWTTLFFSGGLNQGLYPSRAAAAGVHGRGAAGVGGGIEYGPDWASMELRAMLLRALAAPPPTPHAGTGLTYGFEVDTRLRIPLGEGFGVAAELGVLLPGDFFESRNVAYRAQTLMTVGHGG